MFDYEKLLVDREEAVELLNERLENLYELTVVGENLPSLAIWHDDTRDTFDAIFENGGGRAFEKNSGFSFALFVNRPKELRRANVKRAEGVVRKTIAELRNSGEVNSEVRGPNIPKNSDNQRIFVVHGHAELQIAQLKEALTALGLTPIVLREQANRGATVIEKFEQHSDVGFAVVLMTPDDLGDARSSVEKDGSLKPRARQNVILELGYFIGSLGRDRVCVLTDETVDQPSDILGIVYTPFDEVGRWKFDLVKELKAAGFNVSADAIL